MNFRTEEQLLKPVNVPYAFAEFFLRPEIRSRGGQARVFYGISNMKQQYTNVAFLCVFMLCLSGFSMPAFAADKWLSIHTKNFLLVGNASESDIRRVGRTLEEFRSAVAMVFPKMEQTSSVPATIFVFKNDESFKPFKPLYKGQPSNALAFFQPGEDVNYIAVTATTLTAPNIVLHEYVHFLLRENVGGLPLWISEGLAECYSTFDLSGKQNEFTIGRAPERTLGKTLLIVSLVGKLRKRRSPTKAEQRRHEIPE